MEVKYTLDEGAFEPIKAHEADAGFDLRTPKRVVLSVHSSVTIDTGVHIAIPEGYVGFLKSKSGLNVNRGIQSEGVIDSGYTGSIVVKLYNNGDAPHYFYAGDKITQLVILPIPDVSLTWVDSLDDTDRGNNGFGSSGR